MIYKFFLGLPGLILIFVAYFQIFAFHQPGDVLGALNIENSIYLYQEGYCVVGWSSA